MVIDGYRKGTSGFPGVLEVWIPEDEGAGNNPVITFILKSDEKLKAFWRRSYPAFYQMALRSGPRVKISPDAKNWIYVRLF